MSLVLPGVRAALTPQWVRHPLWQIARQVPAFHLDFATGQAIERVGGRLGTFTRPSSVKNVWNGSQFVEVAADVPALQRDPATGLWGYLHEPAATNSFMNSNLLTSANGWTHGGVTASAGSTSLGALGVGTAVRETTATSAHEIIRFLTITSGVQVTLSVLLQAQGRRFVRLLIGVGSGLALGDRVAFVDLQDGVISQAPTGSSTATIRNYGNGLFFCTLTVTPSATASTACGFSMSDVGTTTANPPSYAGETSRGVDAWNLQLETGPIATSPIITTGSAVTRAVDTWTWTGAQSNEIFAALGPSYWAYVQGFCDAAGSTSGFVSADNNTNSERWRVGHNGVTTDTQLVVSGGTVQASQNHPAGAWPSRTFSKVVGTFALNDFRLGLTGQSIVADTSGTMPTGLTHLRVGSAQAIPQIPSLFITDIALFPGIPSNDLIQRVVA